MVTYIDSPSNVVLSVRAVFLWARMPSPHEACPSRRAFMQVCACFCVQVDLSSQSSFQRGGWSTNPSIDNPWAGAPLNAPFDQEYYFIMNVAVGGTNGYFPDGQGGKPWSDQSANAANQFWDGNAQWLPTWQGQSSALQVHARRYVFQYAGMHIRMCARCRWTT